MLKCRSLGLLLVVSALGLLFIMSALGLLLREANLRLGLDLDPLGLLVLFVLDALIAPRGGACCCIVEDGEQKNMKTH